MRAKEETSGIKGRPAVAPVEAARTAGLFPIIDTHQHLFDVERYQPPWLANAPQLLRRNYGSGDYLRDAEGLGVTQCVFVEGGNAPARQAEEAAEVIALCASGRGPTRAAIIAGELDRPSFGGDLAAFAKHREVRGVRQMLHTASTPPGFCLGQMFVASVRRLARWNLVFELCLRPTDLGDGAKLADLCPEVHFVLNHCGNADPQAFRASRDGSPTGLDPWGRPLDQPLHDAEAWRRDLAGLARRRNVHCKISGMVARARPDWGAEDVAPIIDHCLDEFGPDRIVFGSDWPICLLNGGLRRWTEAVQQVASGRSESDRRRLMHDNARALYGLGQLEAPSLPTKQIATR